LQGSRYKTIFIILDLGIAIRNILRTNVLKVLREQKDVRIVIFTPITDESFREEIGGDNVFIERLPEWRPNLLVKSARFLRRLLWAEKTNLFTYRNKLERKEGRFVTWLAASLISWLGMRNRLDRVLAFIEEIELKCTPDLERETFDRYQPDLLFYTISYNRERALELTARKRKTKAIAFVHSWDNPTSKGPFLVFPDRVIVWNEILRDEVVRLHNFPREHVHVSGIPQFDIYVEKKDFVSKRDFFTKWGLDPKKRLLTYATGSFGMLPDEAEVVEQVYHAVQGDALVEPCQLLVRLHPSARYECYQKLEKFPHLVIQRPGRRGSTRDTWNPTTKDMYDLAELMNYSDVVVNTASTITIDAACFDTPVVNVAFDGHQEKPYMRSCKRYYDFEHYRNVVGTGGVRIAHSVQELIEFVNMYLQDRRTDQAGRERIRREQCWKLDGQSGRRVAEYILSYLDENHSQPDRLFRESF
jgi:hypothetical protein